MRASTNQSLLRRMLPFVMAGALVVLALMAISRILSLRAELQTQVSRQLEDQLQDAVASWEDRLLDHLDEWMAAAAQNADEPEALQDMLRERQPWFDSIYLWQPPREITREGRRRMTKAQVIFPLPPMREDQWWVRSHPCMRVARLLTMSVIVDPVRVADEYVTGCRAEPLPVRLAAASEAATMLERVGRYEEALTALESAGIDSDLSLRAGLQRDISPFRLVTHRIQRAELLMKQGRVDEALDLLYDTGLRITELDGPEAKPLLQKVDWPILRELEDHERKLQAGRLALARDRAQRRIYAWEEVTGRIVPSSAPLASEAPRLIHDQYHEPPFLLYYGSVEGGRLGAAVQIDQPLLLTDLLSTLRRYREHLVITDNQGSWVAGARPQGDLVVEVPFPRTLSHLRIGLDEGALHERTARLDDQWITPLIVTAFCMVLGFLALIAQVRASRQLRELLARQREFTTRVTHELKTPIAGIKVMAENLETGAFRTDAQRESMARRIVDEADRLTLRVEEVLTVATERRIPDPVVFDPEEVVLEAIDQWGPRLEQAGVSLHADLEPAPEVHGDPTAVRDAISNLLDNALKYRHEDRDSEVWLTLSGDDEFAVIEVTDNGIGIPPSMRGKVFDRFVRVEGPNRGKSGGYGLGLSQVTETARHHQGTVVCEEGPDGGARFTLRLKAAG